MTFWGTLGAVAKELCAVAKELCAVAAKNWSGVRVVHQQVDLLASDHRPEERRQAPLRTKNFLLMKAAPWFKPNQCGIKMLRNSSQNFDSRRAVSVKAVC